MSGKIFESPVKAHRHVGNKALRVLVPRCPLATHLALKNPVLVGGVCEALPRPLRSPVP